MVLSENALTVLRKRYLMRDTSGKVTETPEEMFYRVAGSVAEAERNYDGDVEYWTERFLNIMKDLRFLPNSPAMMNAGKSSGQLAACFVLPVEDSMDSIFNSLKNAALILQSGGGTGFSFSRLRPKSDLVHSTGGIASGPVSFMRVFNTATEVIKQGGARRGANMGILRIDHPDILDFIRIKRKAGELANFNISVAVTDAFMKALSHAGEYDLINPRTGQIYKKVRAKEVFGEIVESAWETGDPGVVFIDAINRDNPTPHLGNMESTNPCGEQPLLPYEACVLGSINVNHYVAQGQARQLIDFESLSRDIETAVRFLDDAIDVNKYPLLDIEVMHKGNRKIGLGIMGWADMLISLEIPYASKKAFELAGEFMRFFRETARQCSAELAGQRGVFPNFSRSVYASQGMTEMRNATTTTIAPTGTLSIIADCSSGIEPLFALAYKRLIMDTELSEMNSHFFKTAEQFGFYSDSLKEQILIKGNLRGIRGIPEKIKRLYKTAHEISFRDHIEMQSRFQKYTDNAVSKTINMARNAKKDDIAQAFLLAFEKGCKGVTVFRYGTRKRGTLVRFSDSD
ncbi:MAG: adenosylcobalamin-dependent ribonucleoside-diphosphate reductase [Nitrospirae bacterium]|nr:adenosylcobalamin-dependent ribonucleoside-diphosphate reductase [Nitrospirota bacterium]